MYHCDVGGAPDDKYRLHALRKVREQEEKAGVRGLADAVSATQAAHAEVSRRVQGVQRAQAALREAVDRADERAAAGEASAQDMVGARQFRAVLEGDLAQARRAVVEAEAEVDACEAREDRARAVLAEAARERKAVEVHYERWQAERAEQKARKQEEEADDIGQALHRRK